MWRDDDKDQFFKQLTVLAETLGEPMSPVRLAGYCSALEDLPLEGVAIGMQEAMKKCRFFPKPAEIRELMALSPTWRRALERTHQQHLLESAPEPMTREEMLLMKDKLSQAVKALALRKRIR
jgi:hypothetical protein